MIQEAYIDQFECRFETPGDALIGLAGLCDTRWVIVRQNDGSGVDRQCFLDHLTRVHASAIDCAAEHFVEAQYAMAIVQVQAAEQFVAEVTKAGMQICFSIGGAPDRLAQRQ